MTTTTAMIFEQPLSEQMRICLKLEQLFNQLTHFMEDPSASPQAVTMLVRILEVIERPDLKSKLTQMLNQYAKSLSALEQKPGVDSTALQKLLDQLNTLIKSYHSNTQRIGKALRQNEFLKQLKSQLASPGGICQFRLPAYTLWLNKSNAERQQNLVEWLSELSDLQNTVHLILKLTRGSSQPQMITGKSGYYHQNLDPNAPCELIRVQLSNDDIYPEFSVGRHRLTIRFLKTDYTHSGRSKQVKANIEFQLSCCRF